MSTSTFVISRTYTVTYVTAKMMHILSNIIRDIGLNPSKFTNNWTLYETGISTWLASGHLRHVSLEVYDPRTDDLIRRWDMEVVYSSVGDGNLWYDAAAVRYAIAKAGLAPSDCSYDVKINTLAGREELPGWQSCTMRSTDGFKRYTIGSTIGGNGLSTNTAYWSR